MVCSMCWPQASGGDSSSVQEQLRDVVSVTASGRSFAALRSDQTAPSAEGIEMNRGAICSKRSPFWCERGDDPTIRSFIPRDPDICSEGTSGPSKHLLYIYYNIYKNLQSPSQRVCGSKGHSMITYILVYSCTAYTCVTNLGWAEHIHQPLCSSRCLIRDSLL